MRVSRAIRGSAALVLGALAAVLALGARAGPMEPQESAPEVVERAAPAVVGVLSSRTLVPPEVPGPWGLFGRPPRGLLRGVGSGVVVRSEGVILTNHHGVEGAEEIRVVLPDRREFPARLLGADAKTDLAVLRIEARNLPVLPFGDSGRLRVGESVLAIGNALGIGQTVSRGIVSAKGRANLGLAEYEDFLQTDAAINPGNSGGALVNLRGELVGINTAIATRTGGFQGIGFAIPSAMARPVMEILLEQGRVDRGQLGVVVQDMTPLLAEAMGGAPDRGAVLTDVVPQGPAEEAGLRRGDMLVGLDGEAVSSAAELRNRVALRGADAEVALDVWREGKRFEVRVRLKPAEETPLEEPLPPLPRDEGAREERRDSGLPGISVAPAPKDLLEEYGVADEREAALVVISVDPRRASAFTGLRRGDLILAVGRAAVSTPEEMRRAVRASKGPVLLTVRRPGGTFFVAVPRPE
jgi:serine protease Do